MNKTPKLRFKEFSGDWESKKVASVFDRVSNKVDVIEDEYYEQIGIRSHGKGIFYKEPVSGKELGNKRVFWVEPDVFVVNIVFAWEQAVAKTTQNEVGMIASHRFPMYRPKENILDLDYITQLFKTPKGKFLLGLASPGGAGRNKTLGQKEFDNLDIVLPSCKEQKKISTFISLIDKKIMKQGEKVDTLKFYKKGMMQKIFSRVLRFKDDDSSDYPEWEAKKLGDIGIFASGTGFSEKYQGHSNLPIKVFKVSDMNLLGNNKYMINANNTISNDILKEMKSKSINKPSIIFAKVGAAIFLERKRIVTTEFLIDNNMMAFIPDDKNNIEFIHSLMNNIQLSRYAQVGALPSYNASDISSIKVKIPCLDEQNKISKILCALDNKIEKEQDKLDSLNEYKKGLLQQIFI